MYPKKDREWTVDRKEAAAMLYLCSEYGPRQVEDLMTALFERDFRSVGGRIIAGEIKRSVEDVDSDSGARWPMN